MKQESEKRRKNGRAGENGNSISDGDYKGCQFLPHVEPVYMCRVCVCGLLISGQQGLTRAAWMGVQAAVDVTQKQN